MCLGLDAPSGFSRAFSGAAVIRPYCRPRVTVRASKYARLGQLLFDKVGNPETQRAVHNFGSCTHARMEEAPSKMYVSDIPHTLFQPAACCCRRGRRGRGRWRRRRRWRCERRWRRRGRWWRRWAAVHLFESDPWLWGGRRRLCLIPYAL